MTLADCIEHIRRRAQTGSKQEAIWVARVALTIMADCLPGTFTEELASELPSVLADDLRRPDWQAGERLSQVELVERIACYEGVTEMTARRHLTAVLETLPETLRANLKRHLFAELPDGISDLIPAGFAMPRMHQVVA